MALVVEVLCSSSSSPALQVPPVRPRRYLLRRTRAPRPSFARLRAPSGLSPSPPPPRPSSGVAAAAASSQQPEQCPQQPHKVAASRSLGRLYLQRCVEPLSRSLARPDLALDKADASLPPSLARPGSMCRTACCKSSGSRSLAHDGKEVQRACQGCVTTPLSLTLPKRREHALTPPLVPLPPLFLARRPLRLQAHPIHTLLLLLHVCSVDRA